MIMGVSAKSRKVRAMIAAIDVHYKKDGTARVACILFDDWTDEEPYKELISTVAEVEEYVSGSFYLRELPCILHILEKVQEPLDTIVVDGFVWLAIGRPGLGAHLHKALKGAVPVIGVAKSHFMEAHSVAKAVTRGKSVNPLYVTAEGIETDKAAKFIENMAGEYRFPTLLKRLDQLTKEND